jgi:NAD dependent epimerase/dehydratase family enzyme
LDDLASIFISILEDKIKPGIYNAVAATNTNKEVTKIIARKNGQGFLPPAIPSFLVKLLFGQKAEIFTESAEVSPSKLKNEGFKFQFTDINKAISDLAK